MNMFNIYIGTELGPLCVEDYPLHAVTTHPDIEKLKTFLLDRPEVDVDCKDRSGKSPLFYATELEYARILLSYGANPNVIDEWGRTPLTKACRYRALEHVRVLLENGANPLIGEPSALERCDEDRDKQRGEVKRALVQEYIDTVWKDGVPSLEAMCAWKMKRMKSQFSEDEQEEWCAMIPDALLHLYFRDWKGAYKWVYKWNESIDEAVLCEMETDLENGKITIEETKEQIDWIGGAKGGKVLWKRFEDEDPREVPILYATSCKGYRRIVELLLSYPDCDVNAKGLWGITALHEAVEKGHEEIVKLLVSHPDIDVNAKYERDGQTPLHMASEFGRVNAMRFLLEHPKIGINRKDLRGSTPLFDSKNAEIAQILLDSGAKPTVVNRYGYTPLSWACCWNELDHVRVLLENELNGANPLVGKSRALVCCHQDEDEERGKAKRALVQEYIDLGKKKKKLK